MEYLVKNSLGQVIDKYEIGADFVKAFSILDATNVPITAVYDDNLHIQIVTTSDCCKWLIKQFHLTPYLERTTKGGIKNGYLNLRFKNTEDRLTFIKGIENGNVTEFKKRDAAFDKYFTHLEDLEELALESAMLQRLKTPTENWMSILENDDKVEALYYTELYNKYGYPTRTNDDSIEELRKEHRKWISDGVLPTRCV